MLLKRTTALEDASTRDALQALHTELRGIKVPKAHETLTTPPSR